MRDSERRKTVGKRLIQAKSLVQHGQWQQWLNDNFQLTERTAQNFMKCSERFGKNEINFGFSSTQMIALLSLPDAEETERFIEQKAAEGKDPDNDTCTSQLKSANVFAFERRRRQ